jgi:desulfoferrodoxin (superoxide reductase-like protein)
MNKTENNKIEDFLERFTNVRLSRRNFLKSLAILIGSLMILGQVENVYAHPPSDMDITFNPTTKVLNAVIAHAVSNPQTHFINKVNIGLNGKEIIQHAISRQDNNANQTVSYLIPDAKAGDTLSVEAYCNISGKLEKEIKVAQ